LGIFFVGSDGFSASSGASLLKDRSPASEDGGSSRSACVQGFAALGRSPEEERVEAAVARSRSESFFDLRAATLRAPLSAQKLAQWNDELIEALKLKLPPVSGRGSGMSREEAEALYQYLVCHPVASMRHLPVYDPQKNFGFCFGRATAVHLEALRRGLARTRVMKIWGVGPMKGGWGHHVAGLVAAEDGGWWAIDPEVKRVVRATDWIRWLRGEQENEREPLMFFISEAERFGPLPGKYRQIDLYGPGSNDIYNGFFSDLIEESAPRPPSQR
ncbi:MAG: hypothetical protein RJB38_1397, partial [Pseudomonadota bacterium]